MVGRAHLIEDELPLDHRAGTSCKCRDTIQRGHSVVNYLVRDYLIRGHPTKQNAFLNA